MPTHDLKYPGELFLKILPMHYDAVVAESNGTVFSNAAMAFHQSIDQARLLAQMPEFVVRATAKQIMFDAQIIYDVTGRLFPRSWTQEEDAKLVIEKNKRLAALGENPVVDEEDVANAVRMLSLICSVDQGHEHPRIGVEALLIALLLQTWTAFESFVTDIWVAAVNANPKKLAKRVSGAKSSEGADLQERKRTVPLTSLERFGFDLTKSMGYLLKDKFDFAGLGGIQSAYLAAFGEDAKDLFNTNELHCANVAALHAIRNCFAHRAGRADSIFLSAISKCPASPYQSLRIWENDKKLEVDGIMVREFFVSTCTNALAFLRFVKTEA
jgi:hypothetical protein